MQEIRTVDLEEPSGWIQIPLSPEDTDTQSSSPIRAFMLQVAILSNHQNGRDTHVRAIKVFGPRVSPLKALGLPLNISNEFGMYAMLR